MKEILNFEYTKDQKNEIEKLLKIELKKLDKKIIVLDDGKISGIGTHEELLENNEIYADVYNSQVKGDDDEYEVAK